MDQALALAVHTAVGTWPLFDSAAALVGSFLPYLFVAAAIAVFFVSPGRASGAAFGRRADRLHSLLRVAAGLLVSLGIVIPAIRVVYAPARPFAVLGWKPLIAIAADQPSFPSGHATAFFFLATLMVGVDRARAKWFFAAAAVIACARVYAGIHWPSDVVWGALLGVATGIAVRKFLPPLHGK